MVPIEYREEEEKYVLTLSNSIQKAKDNAAETLLFTC